MNRAEHGAEDMYTGDCAGKSPMTPRNTSDNPQCHVLVFSVIMGTNEKLG